MSTEHLNSDLLFFASLISRFNSIDSLTIFSYLLLNFRVCVWATAVVVAISRTFSFRSVSIGLQQNYSANFVLSNVFKHPKLFTVLWMTAQRWESLGLAEVCARTSKLAITTIHSIVYRKIVCAQRKAHTHFENILTCGDFSLLFLLCFCFLAA